MKELLISKIAPIAATAITAILCIVIKQLGKAGTDLLVLKKKESEQKIESNGYKDTVDKAIEAWHIVDDKFRLTQNAMEVFGSKEKLFEQILLQKVPGLTQKNIDDLRETISGAINQGRQVVIQDDTAQQIKDLQQEKATLEIENANLKAAINKINSTIQPITESSVPPVSGETVSA